MTEQQQQRPEKEKPIESFDRMLARMQRIEDVRAELAYQKAVAEVDSLAVLTDKTAYDQIREDYVEPLWRIEGLHIQTSFTTITAPKKTGKSTLVLNLMRSLVDGVDFLGCKVNPVERKVGYWNLELDNNVWLQWAQEMAIQNTKLIVPTHLRGMRFPLYHPEMYKRIIEWLKRNEIEALVIDPGALLLRGWPVIGNGAIENNNDVIGNVCHLLREMVRDGEVTDLFMPLHTGHAGGEHQHSRGAIAWEDNPDHLWSLWGKAIVKGDDEIRHFKAFGRNVNFDTVMIDYDEATHVYTPEYDLDKLQRAGWVRAFVKALTKLGDLDGTQMRSACKGVSNENWPQAKQAALDSNEVQMKKVGHSEIWSLTGLKEAK